MFLSKLIYFLGGPLPTPKGCRSLHFFQTCAHLYALVLFFTLDIFCSVSLCPAIRLFNHIEKARHEDLIHESITLHSHDLIPR